VYYVLFVGDKPHFYLCDYDTLYTLYMNTLSPKKRKVALIAGGGAATLLLAIFVLSTSETTRRYAHNLGLTSTETSSAVDSDGDGLADWEEVLWKTNPNSADTDGDGTPDKTEIDNNRNPSVAGPDDTLADHPVFPSYTKQIRRSTSTTKRMARRLAADYQEVRERGIPLTPEIQQALVSSSYREMRESLPKAQIYTLDVISTHSNASNAALRTYGYDTARLINNNTRPNAGNEYVSFLLALEENDMSHLNDMREVVAGYRDIRDALLNLTVPKTAAGEHLHLINSVHAVAHIVNSMSDIDTDPARGIAAYSRYRAAIERLTRSFDQLNALFEDNNIHYANHEAPAMFSTYASIKKQ